MDLAVFGPQNAGTDTLAGIETLIGSRFDDEPVDGDSADSLSGGAGRDAWGGGLGDGAMTGGAGMDIIGFSEAPTAVTVALAAGTAAGGGDDDTLSGVENVIGSASGDTLIADANANVLSGGLGPDALEGRSGKDPLDGGDESGTAVFSGAGVPARVNLGAGTSSGNGVGRPGLDRASGRERLRRLAARQQRAEPSERWIRRRPSVWAGPDTCRGGSGRDNMAGCVEPDA